MYAAIIMRAEPLHLAHCDLIQRMIDDGHTPVVFLGSSQESGTERNPYTYEERTEMLKLVFPMIATEPLEDSDNEWDPWISNVRNLMDIYDTNILYTFNKLEDRYENFRANGRNYHHMFFSDALADAGATIVNITETNYPDLHARDIRKDLKQHEWYIHPKVFIYLKKKQHLDEVVKSLYSIVVEDHDGEL